MRIAVIGSGIAGLTTASVLCRRHEVTVLERDNRIGGHTHTVSVREGERRLGVDTGFIVFNQPNYPNLLKLFDRHQVAVQDSDMSFSVHDEGNGFEYNATTIDALFAQRSNLLKPAFWGMLGAIIRFHKEAPAQLAAGLDDSLTVAQYVRLHRFPQSFFERYLVPLGASLWSCDASRFGEFPVRFVLEFLHNHHMLQVNDRPTWKTVKGGSNEYVKKLIGEFKDRIFLEQDAVRVERRGKVVNVSLADGRSAEFDEVILACHADQARAMVADIDDAEDAILEAFPYQTNQVVLHTDTGVLPQRSKVWGSWNYRIPRRKGDNVTVTYNMNKLQRLESGNTYCVSLNQDERIKPDSVIRRLSYEHPVFTSGRNAAQAEHSRMIRRRGLSYCGAYWGYGFHEDGVRSALSVCEGFEMGLDS